jgi:hypothetical protein
VVETERYARCIETSRRVRWEIERDVIRGREFDLDQRFLPEGLARIERLEFLGTADRRLLSQIQGRSYANTFGLVERFIGAKMLELSRDFWFGDQVALEALVRFADEEIKHQALFRRIESMLAQGMPAGYEFKADPDAVAQAVLAAGNWAVLALTCHIELFTLAHYRASIRPDEGLSPLFRDVFRFHWKEESQHALVDELEWRREHARLDEAARDAGVDQLIGLLAAVDGVVCAQADADAAYFARVSRVRHEQADQPRVREALVDAYRWQFIVSGVQEPRFRDILGSLTMPAQRDRIMRALAPLMASGAT